MPLADLKLSIFAFPQKWENGAIHLRALLVPTGSPLVPPLGMPKFAGREWQLRTVVLSGLNGFWSANPTGTAILPPVATVLTPPAGAEALFVALRDGLGISDAPPSAADQATRLTNLGNTRIRKQLPPSYTGAFAFERSRTEDAGVGDEFGCALRDVVGGLKEDQKPSDQVSWGRVIAYALRQPELAVALGLVYRDLQVPVGDITQLKDGGWLYLELDPTIPGQIVPPPDAIRSYAARLPALDQAPRGLFGAVLFPVGQTSQAGYDEPLAEAAIYDDGFAKIMHSFQPDTADAASSGHNKLRPATDCGIDLGWDDEQVVIWHNRQLKSARVRLGGAAMKPSVEAPLGVGGYRIDVRPEGAGGWQSLCAVHSVNASGNPAPLVFPSNPPTAFSKSFSGELTVEPAPARSLHADSKGAWLPRYFTRWHGRSLVVNDDTLFKLTGGLPKKADNTPLNPPQSQNYAPDGADIELLYGKIYEFRCRLADLTGGGPVDDDDPERPAPAPITKLRFLRHVPPKALRVATDPPAPAVGAATDVIRQIDALSLRRPLMGYPEFIFAGVDRAKVLQGANNLFTQVTAAKDEQRAIGVADPDVAQVVISVQVRLPAQDPGPAGTRDGQFREIYQVTRSFTAYDFNNPLADQAPLQIGLDYVDVHDLEAFVADIAANPASPAADLPIPRARDVRLRLTPFCADVPNHYAEDKVREGLTVDLATRASALDESDLFVADVVERQLNGIFLQPGDHLPQQLAQHLDLTVKNLAFAPKPGRRVVFGASNALRHSLTGDHGVITFAAESEIKNHWVVAIMLDLDRDWTWDGLQDRSFEVARKDTPQSAEHVVGQIDLRFAVNELALLGDDAQFPDRRTITRLIFFDAVNPVPPPGQFPQIAHPTWIVRPRLRTPAAAPGEAALAWSQDIELPVASAPRQMPKVVSAGVALSPYKRDEPAYSSTEPRRRALWLKMDEPVADPNDRLFARVLAYGPDPLLSGDITHKLFPNSDPRRQVRPALLRGAQSARHAGTGAAAAANRSRAHPDHRAQSARGHVRARCDGGADAGRIGNTLRHAAAAGRRTRRAGAVRVLDLRDSRRAQGHLVDGPGALRPAAADRGRAASGTRAVLRCASRRAARRARRGVRAAAAHRRDCALCDRGLWRSEADERGRGRSADPHLGDALRAGDAGRQQYLAQRVAGTQVRLAAIRPEPGERREAHEHARCARPGGVRGESHRDGLEQSRSAARCTAVGAGGRNAAGWRHHAAHLQFRFRYGGWSGR